MTFREVVATQFRILYFRPVRISLKDDFVPLLSWVLVVTWVVGIGRYWDHPSAGWWQYAGLGSLAYIVCLSTLLFLVVWPLRPENWSFRGVLVFVGMTSLPALLYATPVERFMPLDAAQAANAWFLAIVAAWRVALLLRYLLKTTRLPVFMVATACVLLLSGIVAALAMLNLEHVVFDIMSGTRDSEASQNDTAYVIVLAMAILSIWAFPLTLLVYLGCVVTRWRKPSSR